MTYFFVFCNILFIKEINNLSPMAKNLVTLDLDNTSYEFRPYGTCSTVAATAAKSVAISGFTLCTGATVIVKFTTTNTATNPTLNVNSTGAKSLNLNNIKLIANNTYEFRYNGSSWDCISISDMPKATKNSIGGIKSANDRTAASNLLSGPIITGGTIATRYYGIETTSDGIGFVNVPWKDYTLPEATSDTLGGIKLGYGLKSGGSGKVNVACDGTTIGTSLNGDIEFGVTVATSNIESITDIGVYNISGTRNANDDDGLPITNAGAYSGRLFVYTAAGCVSQYLHLLNAGGGDSNYYIRTQQNGTWSTWAKLQTNVETGVIDQAAMDDLIDNGIYSGILSTTGETFVIITINNYAIAEQAGVHHISQLKYSLVVGSGEVKIEKRTRDAYGIWTEWEAVGGTNIPVASDNTLGGIKLGYTQTGKNYPVVIDGNFKAYVNVPWTDTKYTLPTATTTALGGIKLGYTQTGKNYPVVLDSNSKAYVNVPWTNENTNYAKKLNVATSVSSNKLLKNTTYVLTNQTININDIEEPSNGEVATYNLILKNCDIQFNKKIYWYNGIKPENTNILFIEVVITGVKTGSTTIYTATFGTYTEV